MSAPSGREALAPRSPYDDKELQIATQPAGLLSNVFFRSFVPRRVEPVHRGFDSVVHERFDRVGGPADRVGGNLPLLGGEGRQHVVGEVPFRIAASDTDP